MNAQPIDWNSSISLIFNTTGVFFKNKIKKILIVTNVAILFRIFISIALYHTFYIYIYTHIDVSFTNFLTECCYHISRSIFVNAIYCNGHFWSFHVLITCSSLSLHWATNFADSEKFKTDYVLTLKNIEIEFLFVRWWVAVKIIVKQSSQ